MVVAALWRRRISHPIGETKKPPGKKPGGFCLVIAFSSEVDVGSRKENASKQESRALVLIQSEPNKL
jgi:hypothetical protein